MRLSHWMLPLALLFSSTAQAENVVTKPPSSAEILAASSAADWRRLAPERLLVMQLPSGTVVIGRASCRERV